MNNSNPAKAIIFCSLLTLAACGGNRGDDCKSPPREYSVNHYQGTSLEYTDNLKQAMVDPSNKPATPGAEIPWRRLALSLKADIQTYYVHRPHFSLFASAHACSPSLGQARQTLSKISITSAQNFNAQYPAGSELASLFNLLDMPFNSVTDLPSGFPAPQTLTIFLREQPDEGVHNFLVTIALNDGRNFEFSSGDIYLK